MIQAIWNDIETWFEKNAPNIRIRLLSGAQVDEIETLETDLSITLPEDFKASLMIHNGQHGLAKPLVGSWQLASTEAIRREWQLMQVLYEKGSFTGTTAKAAGPVKAAWWLPQWIPIAYNGAGDLLCLDMVPAPQGNVGQVVSFWHVQEKREVVAASFTSWLQEFAADLLANKYQVQGKRLARQA